MLQLFNQLNVAAKCIILVITVIFFTAIVLSFIIKRKYGEMHEDFIKGKKRGVFRSDVLNRIMSSYRDAAEKKAEEINTQAIIEKEFLYAFKGISMGERFIRQAISLMIILGLLGTFYGLTLSIRDLVSLLGNNGTLTATSGIESLIGGLVGSIEGMGVAFITSLFGIVGAILLTIFKIIVNVDNLRNSTMLEIEEYLDNTIALEYINYAEKNTLDVTVNKLFNGLSEQIEVNYKNVLDKSLSGLIEVLKMMEENQQDFNNSLMYFKKTIDQFSDNTRDFTEFNYHLRNNVDRMNVALSDFAEKIKNN
ncbi:hypothetical protein CLTEP_14650 [Clostridium tepidiprofundi DSM 19306]|uniref:Uncharacterized protein n=1 Tax=Clostridium tepidiprofundi DSM 19306 TaxID=1121338 RepID=A0A151B4Q2_9CLOT|nr:MotA/TolQ/ExbB proton channel family protein [Clostridium tepidiprofundi]KYH34637.1 hypothetical protein CLTEP_14650 [Clostridium tepidiprofundi DSM 19306]